MKRPLIPNPNNCEEITFTIKARVQGYRIDQYLGKRFKEYSRAFFQKLIKEGKVQIDGKIARASSKIRTGQKITLSLPKLEPLHLEAQEIPIEILYEDDQLVVINKPAGLVIHPSRGHREGTLVNALLFYFDQLSDCNDVYRPGIIHRLDRDTTGVLLVAKTNLAHRKLSEQFENRKIKKEYLALVEGNLAYKEGIIALPIGIDTRNRERMAICHGGKEAITEYKVIACYPNFSLLHVFPKTGRTHQIRIHLKSQGHPLVGDSLYGASPFLSIHQIPHPDTDSVPKDRYLIKRQALHAWRIEFIHPIHPKKMNFLAPLPKDFQNTLQYFHSLWPLKKVEEILLNRISSIPG